MSVRVVSIEDDGVAALACAGEINALAMRQEAGGLTGVLGDNWPTRRVALDLSEASYMDSAAIGWLLSIHKKFGDAGGRLIVYGMHPNVQRVVEVMRIDQVLELANNRDDALRRARGDE